MITTVQAKLKLAAVNFRVALDLANLLDFLFEKRALDETRLLYETVFKKIYVEDGKITKNSELFFEKKRLIP